ncbi:Cupin domain protein [Syntrophus gentianae]|uniref:Cupin domain protein n=2 Tax=Syntrophus gentianae TaxID=43775 RepID=A0A1H7Z8F4_9BACT|nr:Cupin domain protein [Syntrophus gentianae]
MDIDREKLKIFRKGGIMEKIKEKEKGIPFNLENEVAYADGSVVSKTLLNSLAGTVTLFSFDAGQGLSEHTAPFDAMVHLLDGEAKITIGGNPNLVSKGDMLIMPANVPHALMAEKPFKMLLIMIRGKQE